MLRARSSTVRLGVTARRRSDSGSWRSFSFGWLVATTVLRPTFGLAPAAAFFVTGGFFAATFRAAGLRRAVALPDRAPARFVAIAHLLYCRCRRYYEGDPGGTGR